MLLIVDDLVCDQSFDIEGLQFEPNFIQEINGDNGWFTTKLMSSEGPLISDFVTHEEQFQYSTYGIHIGQDDRLTFMGENGKRIHGYFVDCRKNSPTLHNMVAIDFAPNLHRRLIIPRGVAHTFDHLEHIVTRDEPVWHADENNPAWNVDNDLVAVFRNTELSEFPIIRVNKHRLPDEAHLFMSRLSQSLLLESSKSYLSRFPVKIGGTEQFIMLESKSWVDDEREIKELIDVPIIPGVNVQRNRYALTGSKSWTLVPNTASCVADVLLLPATKGPGEITQKYHARTKKWYTFLNHQGVALELDFVDLRSDSPTFGMRYNLRTICDPRISIAIEHGIGYSIRCSKSILVRCEHEVFVDQNEPRTDIPMFNQDILPVSIDDIGDGLLLPKLRCPDAVVYKMAKLEQQEAITS